MSDARLVSLSGIAGLQFHSLRFLCDNQAVEISFDPLKRTQTLVERGLDFADAAEVFAGNSIDIPDRRQNYGEDRIASVGVLQGRMVIVVWTLRGDVRRIISMRKANKREQERYGQQLG